MDNLKIAGNKLNDAELSSISGGIAEEGNVSQKLCPRCKTPVVFSRNTRYDGGDLTLYKCPSCNREYSLLQVEGVESLAINYTGLGDDNFGR
jgi:hypothetical protein